MKQKLKIGDIILISIPDCSGATIFFVPAQVLFISKIYRNVIQIGIYNVCLLSADTKFEYPKEFCELLYTSQVMIKKDKWLVIDNRPIELVYKDSSLRNVAGNLYINDDLIRTLSTDEYNKYPKMLVAGVKSVENKIRRILS